MPNQELQKYIQAARTQGVADDVIKQGLIKSGWPEAEVGEALTPQTTSMPNLPPPPVPKFGMWITFQYAVFFLALYVTAVSLGTILDQIVDQVFPDALLNPGAFVNPYASSGVGYAFKWAVSALIVSFPIFAILFISIRKGLAQNPAIRNFDFRKKLIYMTMFVASIIAIFNLIYNIYQFLFGTFSINSFGHLLVLLLITGSVFFYFLHDVKEDRAIRSA